LINKYFFIFISVGLLIAANPYLAIKVYSENQNIWQDCYATPMASLYIFLHWQKTRYAQTVLPAQKNAPTDYLY